MKKGIFLVCAVAVLVLGVSSIGSAQGGPVIEKIWVAPAVNYGKLLKIYIMAKDPEGDMRYIYISAAQGGGAVPIWIPKASRGELNGYVYWDTNNAKMQNISGTVQVSIEDRKGNESQTMQAPAKIVPKGAKSAKAPAEFKEMAIGPVMLGTFRSQDE